MDGALNALAAICRVERKGEAALDPNHPGRDDGIGLSGCLVEQGRIVSHGPGVLGQDRGTGGDRYGAQRKPGPARPVPTRQRVRAPRASSAPAVEGTTVPWAGDDPAGGLARMGADGCRQAA